MATFDRECDVGQAFNFKQDEHYTFGYMTGLVIGDTNLGPDFKVADPLDMPAPPKKGTGAAGEASGDTSGMFKKPVTAVLSQVTWSTQPTDMIDFKGRISAANAQLLAQLTYLSMTKIVLQCSFVVFDYDSVNNVYFPVISSFKGTAPVGMPPGKIEDVGFGTDSHVKPIYGIIGKEGNAFKLTIESKMAEDPPGFKNYEFSLSIAPTASKESQQIQIQTSAKVKLILPWGLPQQ